MTLGEKLDRSSGRPSGFDYMRLGLSLAVFAWHAVTTTYGETVENIWWNASASYSVLVWILPAFFALSGFLVSGSLERCKTIAGFLYLRLIRIFPALVVEITISALILGPLVTTLPLGEYFRNHLFFQYFENCLGNIHYFLPGVFPHNPLPGYVNRQLWTIPFELKCYIVVAVLGIIGISKNRWLLLAAVLFLFGHYIKYRLGHPEFARGYDSGQELVLSFLFGLLFYSFRKSVPHSLTLALLAVAAEVGLALLPNGRAFTAPFVAYSVAYFGMLDPKRIRFLESGSDYSYGIYLYSFPIQQVVAAFGLDNGWLNLAVSVPPVMVVAGCSWHFWEKRCLELRRFRPSIDTWFSFTGPGKIVGRVYRLAVPEREA